MRTPKSRLPRVRSASGCEIMYVSGSELDYAKMREQDWKVQEFIVAGKSGAYQQLLECIQLIR